MARSFSGASVKGAGQSQEISPEQQSLLHQQRMADIEAEHAGDSQLGKQAKITAEYQKQLEIDKEKQKYTAIEDRERGNPGPSNAGATLQASEDLAAKNKAHAEEIELQRQETDQIIQMQNEAVNAGLEGNALRARQEQEQIDAITRKFLEGEISKRAESAETSAIQRKFGAEALKLQEQLDEQTRHMADEAAQSGLKGIPLLNAQLQTQLDAIDAAERKAVGAGGIETPQQTSDFASQRTSAHQSSNQKILESQEQFNERIRALTDSADDAQLEGYARIEVEESKHLKALSDDFEHQYSTDGSLWAGYQQKKIQIELDSDREMAQLHQKAMDQIAKEEEQTARLSLAPWQQTALKIQDEWQDKVRAITEAEDQQLAHVKQNSEAAVMVEQEGNEKRTAAYQLMNAQMQQADEETRDKLASGLKSMFSNPAQFFENRAMDTAYQMMANQMLGAFKSNSSTGGMLQYLFGMGPQMSTSTNPLTDIESAFGMGGHGAGGTTQTVNPSMISFQNGSTTLLTGSQALLTAATTLQSAAGTMAASGGMGSMGGGGFGMSGSTGGASASGMAGAMPGAESPDLSGTLLSDGNFINAGAMPDTQNPDLSGTLNADGSFTSAGAGSSSKYLGAAMGMAGGSLMAGSSIYSAYENSNPTAGAVGGAMGGMEAGAALGSIVPGLGTVVGGAIGAVVGGVTGLLAGIFGDQGKGQAESLDVGTIQPTLLKDMQDYEAGRSGYSSLSSELNSLLISSKNSTASMGSGARSYYGSTIAPEINAALSSLQKQEIGGRSQVTLTAGQYHTGGLVDDFGDLATSDTEGFIHAMRNEFVVQPSMAQAHAPLLNAIQSNNVSYGSSVQPRMPAISGSGAPVTLTVQALDSKSVAAWAKGGGGLALMSALNQAQRQYSGVGRG
jgi:hypothetical protein